MKRLLILSGKGGTGKTTTASALIHFSGAKAMADCDVDAPNLHLVTKQKTQPMVSDFFGGDKAVIDSELCIGCGLCQEHCRFDAITAHGDQFRIQEYACEGCGVCEWICPQKAIRMQTDKAGTKELYLDDAVFSTATLKMGRGNSGKLVTDVKMAMLQHAPNTDLAIIDGSPGIGCPVIASVSGMDLVLVVTEPSLSGLSDLQRLYKTTKSFRTRIAVCVNKWDISEEYTAMIKDYCDMEGIPFAGKIPYDKHASKAINAGVSLAEIDCPAQKALKGIYETVMDLLNQQN